MRSPLFFPPPRYVRTIDPTEATTVADLCTTAGIPCRASGSWTQRAVVILRDNALSLTAEPGHVGTVSLTVPVELDDRDTARFALCTLAYGLHDLVARQSVAGMPWARPQNPPGRGKSGRAMTSAERQRRYRTEAGR